jgi:hypothetical protein
MAYCKIQINNPYTFTIIAAATFPFSNEEFMMLKNCSPDIHYNYQQEDVLFAKVSANAVNNFPPKKIIYQNPMQLLRTDIPFFIFLL